MLGERDLCACLRRLWGGSRRALDGITTIDNGNRTAGDFEGFDLLNFGSTDSGTIITLAGGARYSLTDNLIAGLGYEAPLTNREDIINWKFYADLVITF